MAYKVRDGEPITTYQQQLTSGATASSGETAVSAIARECMTSSAPPAIPSTPSTREVVQNRLKTNNFEGILAFMETLEWETMSEREEREISSLIFNKLQTDSDTPLKSYPFGPALFLLFVSKHCLGPIVLLRRRFLDLMSEEDINEAIRWIKETKIPSNCNSPRFLSRFFYALLTKWVSLNNSVCSENIYYPLLQVSYEMPKDLRPIFKKCVMNMWIDKDRAAFLDYHRHWMCQKEVTETIRTSLETDFPELEENPALAERVMKELKSLLFNRVLNRRVTFLPQSALDEAFLSGGTCYGMTLNLLMKSLHHGISTLAITKKDLSRARFFQAGKKLSYFLMHSNQNTLITWDQIEEKFAKDHGIQLHKLNNPIQELLDLPPSLNQEFYIAVPRHIFYFSLSSLCLIDIQDFESTDSILPRVRTFKSREEAIFSLVIYLFLNYKIPSIYAAKLFVNSDCNFS